MSNVLIDNSLHQPQYVQVFSSHTENITKHSLKLPQAIWRQEGSSATVGDNIVW